MRVCVPHLENDIGIGFGQGMYVCMEIVSQLMVKIGWEKTEGGVKEPPPIQPTQERS